ncbi:MAG: hypothetical protein SFU98_15825 [Leptospiraceae bacterium]|nr:hypothetical protein [Leptospiraceae bacterium]
MWYKNRALNNYLDLYFHKGDLTQKEMVIYLIVNTLNKNFDVLEKAIKACPPGLVRKVIQRKSKNGKIYSVRMCVKPDISQKKTDKLHVLDTNIVKRNGGTVQHFEEKRGRKTNEDSLKYNVDKLESNYFKAGDIVTFLNKNGEKLIGEFRHIKQTKHFKGNVMAVIRVFDPSTGKRKTEWLRPKDLEHVDNDLKSREDDRNHVLEDYLKSEKTRKTDIKNTEHFALGDRVFVRREVKTENGKIYVETPATLLKLSRESAKGQMVNVIFDDGVKSNVFVRNVKKYDYSNKTNSELNYEQVKYIVNEISRLKAENSYIKNDDKKRQNDELISKYIARLGNSSSMSEIKLMASDSPFYVGADGITRELNDLTYFQYRVPVDKRSIILDLDKILDKHSPEQIDRDFVDNYKQNFFYNAIAGEGDLIDADFIRDNGYKFDMNKILALKELGYKNGVFAIDESKKALFKRYKFGENFITREERKESKAKLQQLKEQKEKEVLRNNQRSEIERAIKRTSFSILSFKERLNSIKDEEKKREVLHDIEMATFKLNKYYEGLQAFNRGEPFPEHLFKMNIKRDFKQEAEEAKRQKEQEKNKSNGGKKTVIETSSKVSDNQKIKEAKEKLERAKNLRVKDEVKNKYIQTAEKELKDLLNATEKPNDKLSDLKKQDLIMVRKMLGGTESGYFLKRDGNVIYYIDSEGRKKRTDVKFVKILEKV